MSMQNLNSLGRALASTPWNLAKFFSLSVFSVSPLPVLPHCSEEAEWRNVSIFKKLKKKNEKKLLFFFFFFFLPVYILQGLPDS